MRTDSRHVCRALELGISTAAVKEVRLPLLARSGDRSSVRVLQWNLLADGMSNDGFLLRDILADPDGFEDVGDVLQCVAGAKAHDMTALRDKFCTPRAANNAAAVVDWQLRWARMKEVVVEAVPDVITLQELDHMALAHRELAELGYACSLPGGAYAPAHLSLQASDTAKYLAHLEACGVAYAPNFPSTCRKIHLQKDASANVDDDGCAIFWRAELFDISGIDFFPFKSQSTRNSCAVRASLRRKSDDAPFFVICAHLSSGGEQRHEAARVREVTGGEFGSESLRNWFARTTTEGPTLFCLDANSAPNRDETRTVWKIFRGVDAVRSVWDAFFTPDGAALCDPLPVTTNKMRGPLSQQTAKIGEHMCHVIDHVFFSSAFSFVQHALLISYVNVEEARRNLLPSLAIPSDHIPLVLDFDLPVRRNGETAVH